jgi:heme A synthase
VSLISLVILLIVVGVLLWAMNTYLPMDTNIKKIINILVIVVVVVWLLGMLGVLPDLNVIRIGK